MVGGLAVVGPHVVGCLLYSSYYHTIYLFGSLCVGPVKDCRHEGRPDDSGPHTWWVLIEGMLISLVLDGERTEITKWLTGVIQ